MNEILLKKAETLKQKLQKTTIFAVGDYGVLKKGDDKIFDLGNHFVGYATIHLSKEGGVIDAPFILEITFGETKDDLDVDVKTYQGDLSGGWLQKEWLRVEECPTVLKIKRRYACRFLKIKCVAASSNYMVRVDKITFREETSAKGCIQPLDGEFNRIDKISLRTLRSCMQDVFEDGPKRDRRLWLGDLRLQALANYVTYQNNDLVKRCLYLFAATAKEDELMKGNVFTSPSIYVEPLSKMFDFPLLFIPTLYEYAIYTKDIETAEELFPIALQQLKCASRVFDKQGCVGESIRDYWCFVDWEDRLDRRPCAHAIYLYAAKYARKLSLLLGQDNCWIDQEIENKAKTAINRYYDKEKALFVGENGQISYAVNTWFCLAEVFTQEENAEVLLRLEKEKCALKPITPYLYHYYVQALLDAGQKEKAKEVIFTIWGGMAKLGADTFFEIFDPERPNFCPYGDSAMLSRCHAWSATPSYFLRKYFLSKE